MEQQKLQDCLDILLKFNIWSTDAKELKTKFHQFSLQNHPDKSKNECIEYSSVSNSVDIALENFESLLKMFNNFNDKFNDNLICFKCGKYGHNTVDKCPKNKSKKTLVFSEVFDIKQQYPPLYPV